jgi:hypothetical protein
MWSGTFRLTLFALAVPVACVAAELPRAADAQTPPRIDELLARVGERIAAFYERAQHVICIETSSVQPIDRTYSSAGFARTVESELRVDAPGNEGGGGGEPTVMRAVRTVNGRPPRPRDAKDRAGCTDPNPLSTEPLAFLLPAHRSEYKFRLAGYGQDRHRPVLLVDFASVDSRSRAELIEDPAGHDDCFDWSGHVASRGRLWVDTTTFDVLRIDRGLPAMLDVRVPLRIQRKHNLDTEVIIERQDTTIRYRTVAFSDPDEVLLLPESIDTLIVARGGLQSTRGSQVYSDYRRFVGSARIVDDSQ